MSMVKRVSPAGQESGEPSARLVKISSRGLIGNDRKDFLKVASPIFAEHIDEHGFPKDEEPLHQIGLGSTESTGSNVNGDGFMEKWCMANHHHFVKHARYFRDHVNGSDAPAYGRIAKSAYNLPMRRVELLIGLNKTASAAARNNGFVADKEMAKLAKGEDLPGSMSCKIKHDVCDNCGNVAPTRASYCDESNCVSPAGVKRDGCKKALASVYADGYVQHVDNPDPFWFDFSHVVKQADPIAFGAVAEYAKSASAKPNSKIGIQQDVPLVYRAEQEFAAAKYGDRVAAMLKIAEALSLMEGRVGDDELLPFADGIYGGKEEALLAFLGPFSKSASGLRTLAMAGIVLPFKTYARWAGKQASAGVGDVYTRIGDGLLTDSLASVDNAFPFDAPESFAPAELLGAYSLKNAFVRERTVRAVVSGKRPTIKAASSSKALMAEYAAYQLAALFAAASDGDGFHAMADRVVAQNRVH